MHYQISGVVVVPKTLRETLQVHGDRLSEHPHMEFLRRRPLIGKIKMQ
jgi:hypothetical protein